MRLRRVLSPLLLLSLVGVACLPGGRLPRTPGAAGWSSRSPKGAERGPFRVAFAGPEGEDVSVVQPEIVFSRPVRALGQVPSEPRLDARFEPPLPGHWEWLGTSAARFVPDGQPTLATRYTLSIDELPPSLDGEHIASPVRLSFATPRPRLASSSPEDGSADVHPSTPLAFELSQAIPRARLEAGLTLRTNEGQALPFALEAEPNGELAFRVVPREPWPEGARITMTLAEGILPAIGTLGTKPGSVTFDTREPLGISEISCSQLRDGRCENATSIQIQLDGDMRPSELRALVSIEPPVRLDAPNDKEDTPTAWHSISGDFQVGVRYAISVRPAEREPVQPPKRKDVETEPLRRLARGARKELLFAPPSPGVHFSFWGTYLPPTDRELAARAEETKVATAGVVPLDRDAVMRLVGASEDEPVAWSELAGAKTVVLPARASLIDPPAWRSLKELTPPFGPLLFGAKWQGFEGRAESLQTTLQRSDLALHARATTEGTLAWVTSLTTGAPLAGVAVEARDRSGQRATGLTGDDGVVMLATAGLGRTEDKRVDRFDRSGGSVVLFAQKGDDWIYRPAKLPKPVLPKGALFTDRGLYRPGETVQIKGLVRRATSRGLVPVSGDEISLAITDDTGRTSHTKAVLGSWGTFDQAVATAADAPLGYYRAEVSLGGEVIGRTSFQVLAYRPASLSIATKLDKSVYVRGEPLVCTAKASYLYGGVAAGSSVSAWLGRRPTSFAVPGLVGFSIDDDDATEDIRAPTAQREQTLDAEGRLRVELPLENKDQRGPELFTCDVTVVDASFERVATSSSALVHPGEVYVALEMQRWGQIYPGQTITPKVLTVTPEGERRSKHVRVELLRRKRDPKRTWTTLPGEVVATCELETDQVARGCALTAPPGPYDEGMRFVLRASTVDPRGIVSASSTLYPTQPPKRTPPAVLRRRAKKTRELPAAKVVRDRETYQRDETAHVRATSPFAQGHVLWTVEREGMLRHEVRAVTREPVPLDVPIEAASAPYVDATATFVAPYADKTLHRRLSAASTRIESNWVDDKLALTVRPAKSLLAPGEEVDIDVEVRDAKGGPVRAEVTLYGADEGTLQLARYRLPDPLDSFFQRREATVLVTDTRDDLASLFDWQEELRNWGKGRKSSTGHGRLGGSHMTKPPSIRMGATQVSSPRRNFDQGAFFLPSLETDETGHVHARVKPPESLTTYRVMAFAATKGAAMGAAESSVVTNLPLQVRPILPRVLRAGDRFSLAAMAANNGSTRLEATVSLSLAGSSLVANGPVERRVTLEPGASERVLFDVEAKAVGEGTITLAIASGGVVADSAELPLAITSPVVLETTALSGIVGGSGDGVVDETLADLAGLRADVGSLTVSLSASPLAGLGAGLEQLVQYPYGCTEQTTSRLVPLLHLQPLARALNVKLPDDLPKVSAEAVRRILANQREDGGFGLWAGSKQSEPWLSAYATWGLGEAAKLGVPVDAVALGRARGYLLALLAGWGETTEARVAAPFALDVLVSALEQGKERRTDEQAGSGLDHVSLGEIGAQIASRRAELPVFARAHLLHALALLGRDEEARSALIRELASAVHLDGPLARFVSIDPSHARHFDSSARSGALVLRALLAAEPTHPLVTPLALGLVADRRGGTWRTTHETAWALLALNDYRAHMPEGADGAPHAEVELAGKSVLAHTFLAAPGAIAPDAEITLPMATVLASLDHAGPGSARTLSFAARGGSPIAYQARLRSAPRDRPRDDVTAGFSLQRRYLVVPTSPQSGAPQLSELSFDAGDTYTEGATVLVELTVTTSSERRWVAIDDPLPGGFESLDLDLEGGQGYLRPLLSRGATRAEHRDDRTVFFVDELPPGVTRYTHLVRATQRGRFVAPAAKVEEMYTPETFGRTAARVIQVEAVK